MALRPYPGFVGPSYTSQSKIAAFDRTVNWYPERIESGTGVATYVLYPTPGYTASSGGSGDSPGRGAFFMQDFGAFLVMGTTFSRFGGSVLGSVSNVEDGPVSIITNGDSGRQLLINSDRNTYVFDLDTSALTTVGAEADSIGYVNGYGLRLDRARSEVSFSDLFDFTAWDPLDVFQRNDAPDKWQRLLVHHKEVWLFGTDTTSVYYNGDDPDIPFQPIVSVFIQMGIAARHSACVVDGSVMWLGRSPDGNGVVYRANGYTPERVSTYAVEYALRPALTGVGVQDISTAEGSTYQENGHTFYELTFPGVSTWVYDATEGLWHERGVWNGLEFGCLDTRGHFSTRFNYTLSRTTSQIFLQSTDVSTGTDGLGITRLRRAPHINHAQLRTRFSRFRLLMETGVGLASGQGSDPQIALRWSDDGGQTWSASLTESAGKIGEYSRLVDWWQLGQGRDRVFEVTVSDPVPWRLIDAFLDYTVGSS